MCKQVYLFAPGLDEIYSISTFGVSGVPSSKRWALYTSAEKIAFTHFQMD